MTVTLTPNLVDPDGVYAGLLAAHDGLPNTESEAFNARLILILFNHIGDPEVIRAALLAARRI